MSKWLSWCHCDSDEATVTLLMPQEMFYAWPQASGFMVWLGRLTAMVFNERTPVWNKWPSDMSLYCVWLLPSSIRRRAYRLIVFILCRAGSDQTRQGWQGRWWQWELWRPVEAAQSATIGLTAHSLTTSVTLSAHHTHSPTGGHHQQHHSATRGALRRSFHTIDIDNYRCAEQCHLYPSHSAPLTTLRTVRIGLSALTQNSIVVKIGASFILVLLYVIRLRPSNTQYVQCIKYSSECLIFMMDL